MNIEYELKEAFKRAGFGDVNVTYKKMSVRSGYGLKTEMDILIRLEQTTYSIGNEQPVKLLEDLRGVKTISPKPYNVIRNEG